MKRVTSGLIYDEFKADLERAIRPRSLPLRCAARTEPVLLPCICDDCFTDTSRPLAEGRNG